MPKKIITILFAFTLLPCMFNKAAWSQVGNQCEGVYGNINWGGVPPGVHDCLVEGPWLVSCWWKTYKCPPVAAAIETCLSCAKAKQGNPISLAIGNTYIEETDVSVPGLGGGLTLTRTWNSMWPSTQSVFQIGMFGKNWSSNFEQRVFTGSDYYVKWARGDGTFYSFGHDPDDNSSSSFVYRAAAPANDSSTMKVGDGQWSITDKNGETRTFDPVNGRLLSITDRNGNITQLTYDSAFRLVTVTDPASRHLYFSYGQGAAFSLVSSVTSDFGVSLSYSYDSYQRLIQVTKPDNTHITFEYGQSSINDASSPLITAVKDNDGKILEAHSYDADARGLSGTEALGVNGATIIWPNPASRFTDPIH